MSEGSREEQAQPPATPLSDDHLAEPTATDSWLRQHRPVHRTADGVHVVSRRADVDACLHDPATFSNRFGRVIRGRDRLSPDALEILREGWPPVDTLFTTDPPEHRRFRSLVNRAFTARRVSELEPSIASVASQLVDDCLVQGKVDLVEGLAVPLPLTVIADQLGVPRDDLPSFKRWSQAVVSELGRHSDRDEQLRTAWISLEFQRYFHRRIEERRIEPRDDILSDLVHAEVEGEEPLDDAELLMMLQQLLVAGNETTTNGIASMMALLLEYPEQLAAVREDRSLVGGVIEETLRLEAPIQGMWRITTTDTQIDGCPLSTDDLVLLRYGSANRDEAHYDDPERFDPRRPNPRGHLAFGAGIHFCVGAALARAEMRIALETLLERTSDIRGLSRDRYHPPHLLIRGLTELPVALVPA